MIVRPETREDHAAIADLTARAFAAMPYSQGTEPAIIDGLRRAGALSLSLVAARGASVVGHVAFSPMTGPAGWYALGPVAVEPALQGQGIGSALIRQGLASLRARGAHGCALVGDPNFYGRFGFAASPEHLPPGMPAAYFMLLRFGAEGPAAPIGFHAAFGAAG